MIIYHVCIIMFNFRDYFKNLFIRVNERSVCDLAQKLGQQPTLSFYTTPPHTIPNHLIPTILHHTTHLTPPHTTPHQPPHTTPHHTTSHHTTSHHTTSHHTTSHHTTSHHTTSYHTTSHHTTSHHTTSYHRGLHIQHRGPLHRPSSSLLLQHREATASQGDQFFCQQHPPLHPHLRSPHSIALPRRF